MAATSAAEGTMGAFAPLPERAEGTMGAFAPLPEDALSEVFSRVHDVKGLFRCAATCRPWLRLFTDPDFLRRLWPETDRARLLGLFLGGPVNTDPPIFLPRPERDGRLTPFVPGGGRHFDGEHLLGSRHGVLLSRTEGYRTCCWQRDAVFHLSSPVAGAHEDVALPPDCGCLGLSGGLSGFAILTAADGDLGQETRPPSTRHSAFLQARLLLIGAHHDGDRLHQHLHSYSAATRSWSALTKIRHACRLRMVGPRAAVVHGGAAHWLYADDTVDVSVPRDKRDTYMVSANALTARVSVTKLPITAAGGSPYPCVGRDGRLSVACVHAMRIDVWTQQDGDDGDLAAWLLGQMFGKKKWLLAQVIQMPAAAPAGTNFMSCWWFHFNKGAMLAVYGGNGVFVLDLETKAMEKIMDLSECPSSYGYYRCQPYEMDLPEFILGQLAGLRKLVITRSVQENMTFWTWLWPNF
ncbi:hypothetical protein ACP70R_036147 [Stipagrostis hirtigluma subsp. patula]